MAVPVSPAALASSTASLPLSTTDDDAAAQVQWPLPKIELAVIQRHERRPTRRGGGATPIPDALPRVSSQSTVVALPAIGAKNMLARCDESPCRRLLKQPQQARKPRVDTTSLGSRDEAATLPINYRVVVPPLQQDAVDGNGDAAGTQPTAEVAVVRLNESFYTSSELMQWRQYQANRMDSFFDRNDSASTSRRQTISQLSHSHDAPSSNSTASSPEFLAVLTHSSAGLQRSEGDTEMLHPLSPRLARVFGNSISGSTATNAEAWTTPRHGSSCKAVTRSPLPKQTLLSSATMSTAVSPNRSKVCSSCPSVTAGATQRRQEEATATHPTQSPVTELVPVPPTVRRTVIPGSPSHGGILVKKN